MTTTEDQSRRKDDARPNDSLHWQDECSICGGTGKAFGKVCVCRAADAKRATLTDALRHAALNLLDHNRAAGACIEIDGAPPLYVLVGHAAAMGKMLPEAAPAGPARLVGAKMANTMFNLAQREGQPLDADMCASLKAMQKEWDAAVLAVPPVPAPAEQGDDESLFWPPKAMLNREDWDPLTRKPKEQAEPEQPQAHVMPPFAAPASQHDAELVVLLAALDAIQHDITSFLRTGDTATLEAVRTMALATMEDVYAARRFRAQGGNTSEESGSDLAHVARQAQVAPVAWGLLEIQEPELTNDAILAAYWTRKGRKVTPLFAAPSSTAASAQAAPDEVRNQVLEEALRPFAKLAPAFEGNLDTDSILNDFRGKLTIRHIREAARALRTTRTDSEKGGAA